MTRHDPQARTRSDIRSGANPPHGRKGGRRIGDDGMKYAMQSSVHADHIEASVWKSADKETAILSFMSGLLTGTLSMHIPPAVAQATADAFNEAMEEHKRDEEIRRAYALWKGERAAGLQKPQEELDAELRDAGRGHLVRP